MSHPYATRQYAEIAAGRDETVLALPQWDQWLLRRPLGMAGGADGEDIAGCYPVCPLPKGAALEAGLQSLRESGYVSLVLVADPLLHPGQDELVGAFDLCKPFKTHYLFDRARGPVRYSKHHRYEVKRARANVAEIDLRDHLDEWLALYRGLVEQRGITGRAAFSDDALRSMCDLEGLVAFGAFADAALVACHLWIRSGATVHSHLAAANDTGRRCGASYLLYDAAIRTFDDAAIINFGGSPGLTDDPNDGLARFKRGFANASAPALLCGKVLDRQRYGQLCAISRISTDEAYFPAYRRPARSWESAA